MNTNTQQQKQKWDDQAHWQGVRVGQCSKCQHQGVTRFGLCWTCENETCENCGRNLNDCNGNCIFLK